MSKSHVDNRLDSWRTGVIVLVIALVAGFFSAKWIQRDNDGPETLTLARPAMGTLVEIQVLPLEERAVPPETAEASSSAMNAALQEVARIDSLFSWDLPRPTSMSLGAQAAARRELLQSGFEVMQRSGGAFDPRIGPLVDAWGFRGKTPALPATATIEALLSDLHGGRRPTAPVDLESRPGLLHFGAWAKGYAVDRAVATLKSEGVTAGLVNAGGEIRGFGHDWTVGIQHPRLPGALLAKLQPGTLSVATSGDYEQYFEQDGRRYHHLLDPRTGFPAPGCRSVTILAESCMLADALATAVFVLGPQEGMNLVEASSSVEALIIDADGERHDSSGLSAYLSAD